MRTTTQFLLLFSLLLAQHAWAGYSSSTSTMMSSKGKLVRFHRITQEEYNAILGLTHGKKIITEGRLINSGLAALRSLVNGLRGLPSLFFGVGSQTEKSDSEDITVDVGFSNIDDKYTDGYPLCVITEDEKPLRDNVRRHETRALANCIYVEKKPSKPIVHDNEPAQLSNVPYAMNGNPYQPAVSPFFPYSFFPLLPFGGYPGYPGAYPAFPGYPNYQQPQYPQSAAPNVPNQEYQVNEQMTVQSEEPTYNVSEMPDRDVNDEDEEEEDEDEILRKEQQEEFKKQKELELERQRLEEERRQEEQLKKEEEERQRLKKEQEEYERQQKLQQIEFERQQQLIEMERQRQEKLYYEQQLEYERQQQIAQQQQEEYERQRQEYERQQKLEEKRQRKQKRREEKLKQKQQQELERRLMETLIKKQQEQLQQLQYAQSQQTQQPEDQTYDQATEEQKREYSKPLAVDKTQVEVLQQLYERFHSQSSERDEVLNQFKALEQSPAQLEEAPPQLQQAPPALALQQTPVQLQQMPVHLQQAPVHLQQAPVHLQQAPVHLPQAPVHLPVQVPLQQPPISPQEHIRPNDQQIFGASSRRRFQYHPFAPLYHRG